MKSTIDWAAATPTASAVRWQFVEKTSNIAALAVVGTSCVAVVERLYDGAVHAMLATGRVIGVFGQFSEAQRAVENVLVHGESSAVRSSRYVGSDAAAWRGRDTASA